MKNIGETGIFLGIIYALHKLIGTEPNIDAWWTFIGLGLIMIWTGETIERKAKRKRQAKIAQKMQDVIDSNERWRKERGR